METRSLRLAAGNSSATASIIRFDPQAYRVRVKYDPFNAGFLDQWNTALQPLALINGGFFDENDRATGLVIFDGITRGETYQGFGGMVVINADGEFELRSLRQQPYDPDEPLQQAMQSAPMLIQPGGEVSQLDADTDRSRRSVIAQDRQGRVLLIALDVPLLTLPELAQALAQSDLDLDAALALDGGRSTGLFLNTEPQRIAINSFDQVPLVLTVERRAD
jgi:exopolysaccharide biosynthesis protein